MQLASSRTFVARYNLMEKSRRESDNDLKWKWPPVRRKRIKLYLSLQKFLRNRSASDKTFSLLMHSPAWPTGVCWSLWARLTSGSRYSSPVITIRRRRASAISSSSLSQCASCSTNWTFLTSCARRPRSWTQAGALDWRNFASSSLLDGPSRPPPPRPSRRSSGAISGRQVTFRATLIGLVVEHLLVVSFRKLEDDDRPRKRWRSAAHFRAGHSSMRMMKNWPTLDSVASVRQLLFQLASSILAAS